MAGLGEGAPGDVEPGGARQQLVGVWRGLEEIHEALELRGVLRADIGSLTAEVTLLLRKPELTMIGPTAMRAGSSSIWQP